jgi:hypothetical protein
MLIQGNWVHHVPAQYCMDRKHKIQLSGKNPGESRIICMLRAAPNNRGRRVASTPLQRLRLLYESEEP